MNYYMNERQMDASGNWTAATKARNDIEVILKRQGFQPIPLEGAIKRNHLSPVEKLKVHVSMSKKWASGLRSLAKGDILIMQFPPIFHTMLLARIIHRLTSHGVMVIALVHDIEMLRYGHSQDISLKTRLRILVEEKMVLKACSHILVHNETMAEKMSEFGIPQKKMRVLGIFDYLIAPEAMRTLKHPSTAKSGNQSVAIAGNMNRLKAGYAYNLPENVSFEIYGILYTPEKTLPNVHYNGVFPPEKLPAVLTGKFGLVWDGPSPDRCEGGYGMYLQYNNPHKTSLYLAAGLPVIIWEKAALADFILSNHLGLLIGSLAEIREKLDALTEKEYVDLCDNVKIVGAKIRAGYYTTQAISAWI